MKKFLSISLAISIAFSTAGLAGTFDEKCAVCHRLGDKPASSHETLLKKYKNAGDLIKAAKASTNPMMKAIQGNDDLLKK